MKLTLAVVAGLCCFACEQKESSTVVLPATPAAQAQNLGEAAAVAEKPVAMTVTDELIEKYVTVQKEQLAMLRAKVTEWKKDLAKQKGDPTWRQSAAYLQKAGQLSKDIDEAKASIRTKVGLTQNEVDELGKVVSDVSMARMLWKKGGGDQTIADMEKQVKAQLANMPAAERASSEAEMGKLTESLKDARDAKEARKVYGDKTVELVLKHEAELASVLEQQMTLGLELR